MVGDLLCHFQFAAVLQICRDAGRAKGMIANPRLDAGRFRAPAGDYFVQGRRRWVRLHEKGGKASAKSGRATPSWVSSDRQRSASGCNESGAGPVQFGP
jgi:hypothetical protein